MEVAGKGKLILSVRVLVGNIENTQRISTEENLI